MRRKYFRKKRRGPDNATRYRRRLEFHLLERCRPQITSTPSLAQNGRCCKRFAFECQNWFNANGNKLEDFFDKIFLSQELHLQKPDPEIFKTAIRELGAFPAETIFLDDSPINTAAAAACGLQTLTVTADVDWVKKLFSQAP